MLRAVPLEAGRATVTLPIAPEIALDVVESGVAVARIRIDAVPIRRTVIVVARARRHIVLFLVVRAPVRVFGGRVDQLGQTMSGKSAGNCADGRADRRTHWT